MLSLLLSFTVRLSQHIFRRDFPARPVSYAGTDTGFSSIEKPSHLSAGICLFLNPFIYNAQHFIRLRHFLANLILCDDKRRRDQKHILMGIG